jgi:glucan phosphoethanolaminetransferase (alkaline phosphatase superfamily)
MLFAFYLFKSFNYDFQKLSSKHYNFKIYQLNSQGNWEDYNKKTFPKNRINSIKSVLIFKKKGEVHFKFSFKNNNVKNKLFYELVQNGKLLDSFILKKNKEYNLTFNVDKLDRVEILVKNKGEHYWGNLESTFSLCPFALNEMLTIFIWLLVSLLLYYYGYYYLAIFSWILFFLNMSSEYLNFGTVSFEIVFAYSFYFFSLIFVWVLVYQLLDSFKRFKIGTIFNFLISLILMIVPLIFLLYALNFDHALSEESLYAIFQSNSSESYEYIEKFIDFKYMLLIVLILLGMFALLYKQEQVERKKIDYKQLVFLILLFLSIVAMNLSDYRLNNFIYDSIDKYTKELKLFKEVKAKRKAGMIAFEAKKEGIGETYVVVIGESLNKNHMGIYGYVRETTPNLSSMKKDLILYENAYSNHTHTVPVLSLALTQANQYNKKNYYSSPSIIEVLNKANIETYWLTNQTLYGAWDNKVSVIATESKKVIAINHAIGCNVKTEQYDEVLVDNLKMLLETNSKKNRVIFIHLMGNHSVYKARYPKDKYSIYRDKLKVSQKGIKVKDADELNSYDNAVYYNDYVVNSILKLLQKEKGNRAFLYFSDHSEDIIRDIGHSSEKFTYEMTEIPMIAWFSSEYKKTYSRTYQNFKKHRNKLFSNDMLYDTLIGIVRVKTDYYNKVYDLTSSEYVLKEENALVLHGKQKYVPSKKMMTNSFIE